MIKVIVVFMGLITTQAYASDTDQLVQESRQAVKEIATELKSTLQASMKKDGPVAAIQVCNTKAPEIANKVSTDKLAVARTATRVRNSANKADQWEQAVLTEFEQLKKSGTDISKLEFSEITNESGNKTFRYMKAIPTANVCLKCHGSKLAEPVAKKVQQLYPEDKATGFSQGDIRGAFTVTKKLY